MARIWFCLAVLTVSAQSVGLAQSVSTRKQANLPVTISSSNLQTTDDWNRRIQDLVEAAVSNTQSNPSPADYRIGPDDELAINVWKPQTSQTLFVFLPTAISQCRCLEQLRSLV